MSELSPLCAQKRTSSKRSLDADRLQQDGTPVKIEELLLAASEHAHVDDFCGVEPNRAGEQQPDLHSLPQ